MTIVMACDRLSAVSELRSAGMKSDLYTPIFGSMVLIRRMQILQLVTYLLSP